MGGGGGPVPKSLYGFCGHKATLNWSSREPRSCVKVEVAVLGSPSLIVPTVFGGGRKATLKLVQASTYARLLPSLSMNGSRYVMNGS